jgi:uncharacterized membrane protein
MLTGWLEFVAAFFVFFLSHSLPVRPPLKPWLQARLGRVGFTLFYSLLSLAVLAWLIGAAGRAPFVPLWGWSPWQNHVTLALMLPVCLLLAMALARPNPFSFGGAGNARFDPVRPDIVRLTRHPLLVALALWAGAHLLPNGDLAHALLFGTFATFAALGGRIIDRRKRRDMGADWHRLIAAMQAAPPRPASWLATAIRAVLGLLLYATLIWLHPHLFGVSPLP